MNRETEWSWLGCVGYEEAQRRQRSSRQRLRGRTGPERLLLLEHPPVYTLGRNADVAELLVPRRALAERGIEVHECDRGGRITYHGPGQLVGYPVVDLAPDRRDVRRYVEDLEEVLIRTLADDGIDAEARPMPEIGVWVGQRKIAAVGIHLKRWVTTHGFALNVSTDLDAFGAIVPCGLEGVTMTSIERLTGKAPTLSELAERVAGHFGDVFDRTMVGSGSVAETA